MWRNKEMHDDDFVKPVHSIRYVTNKVEDYCQAKKATEVLRCREYVNLQIGWKPPAGDFVKLNTEGARKHRNIAGCGGIIQDSQGEWLGGFAKGVGDCSAFMAELWGVFEGLSYARRLGFMAVELNIDSVTVEVNIVHAYIESNQCTDALASIGCTLDKEIIYYDDCPSEIKELFLADVMGIATPRMIPV
ncbi:ribonuclease H protein [Trifolium medium]|uniref:Ribonuclease H protein n=1 Tax=Trifolium medium TaxID=97028 RepID=A0A392M0C5_9FABA|nr:ribonuclease H protein [Trifolium medium]